MNEIHWSSEEHLPIHNFFQKCITSYGAFFKQDCIAVQAKSQYYEFP